MTSYIRWPTTNESNDLGPKTTEKDTIISTPIKNRRKKYLVIGLLFILFLVCCVLGGSRFLGLCPRYPDAQSFHVCGSPSIYTFGDSDYWHLSIDTCFKTTDNAEQIYAWYETIGWSGSPQDRLGRTISFSAGIGQFINVSTKRQVLVFDTNVQVNTWHELYVLPCVPTPMEAQLWDGVEIVKAIPAFVRICLH